MQHTPSERPSSGFVYAATGEIYVTLARRAARSLRRIHPDAQIDLFTDAPLEDDVFSKVHILSESWFRPKMDAMRLSRFDRTVCLDADTMVVADLSSMFDVLDGFDIAGCHGRFINNEAAALTHTRPLPDAFAPVNSGVLAIKKSEKTQKLLNEWQSEMKRTGARLDQPVLRELLFDSDLRVWVLPPGYNLMSFNEIRGWWGLFSAPRILHASWLHRRKEGPGDPLKSFEMEELVGKRGAARIRALIRADRNLTPHLPDAERPLYDPLEPALIGWAREAGRTVYKRLRGR